MTTVRFVSTGHLPGPDRTRTLVAEAHERFRAVDDGRPSDVYPALERADPNLFGIAVVGVNGATHLAGDASVVFPIMSVAKPFVFALVCDALGPDEAVARVGANATGLSFNDPAAIGRDPAGRTNPMVNPGAIVTTALVPGADADERWSTTLAALGAFAGRTLVVDEEVYASASATNHRNQELTRRLVGVGAIAADPDEALDRYTRQSCVSVTTVDLATMGATLADGGVNPVTGERVVSAVTCRHVLAAMTTAGLYETSGDWLHAVGLPGKSGIGGGIVTVSPGKGGLGTFSPPVDAAGNSVRGQLVAAHLSRTLGLDLFASEPA
ncbi:MAG: glutaminase A [Acidimicrobiia bacterium]